MHLVFVPRLYICYHVGRLFSKEVKWKSVHCCPEKAHSLRTCPLNLLLSLDLTFLKTIWNRCKGRYLHKYDEYLQMRQTFFFVNLWIHLGSVLPESVGNNKAHVIPPSWVGKRVFLCIIYFLFNLHHIFLFIWSFKVAVNNAPHNPNIKILHKSIVKLYVLANTPSDYFNESLRIE